MEKLLASMLLINNAAINIESTACPFIRMAPPVEARYSKDRVETPVVYNYYSS